MKKQLLALLGAACLVVAACGSDGDDAALDSAADTTTTEAVTTESSGPAADSSTEEADAAESSDPEDTSSDDGESDDGEPDESDEVASTAVREPLTLTTLTAGPITVTPTECVVEGADLAGPSGANSMAFAGDRLFVHHDAGLQAFTFAGPECVLALDTTIGDDGVLSTDDNQDSLSGIPSGRLAATGVLGSTVYDTTEGLSYSCDMTGTVSLSADGTRALTNFPGRDALEDWALTDTNCSEVGAVTYPGIPDVKFMAFDGSDELVGGGNDAEDVVVSRYRGGTAVWTAGGGEIGADDWWGWVHGMSNCGNYTCMIDTNTNALALIDETGTVAAAFEFEDLIGLRGWIEPIVVGPDGAAYVLYSNAVDDENDNRTYFASVIRLDVTG